eukprot:3718363-Amphidinium_carterae.1
MTIAAYSLLELSSTLFEHAFLLGWHDSAHALVLGRLHNERAKPDQTPPMLSIVGGCATKWQPSQAKAGRKNHTTTR